MWSFSVYVRLSASFTLMPAKCAVQRVSLPITTFISTVSGVSSFCCSFSMQSCRPAIRATSPLCCFPSTKRAFLPFALMMKLTFWYWLLSMVKPSWYIPFSCITNPAESVAWSSCTPSDAAFFHMFMSMGISQWSSCWSYALSLASFSVVVSTFCWMKGPAAFTISTRMVSFCANVVVPMASNMAMFKSLFILLLCVVYCLETSFTPFTVFSFFINC